MLLARPLPRLPAACRQAQPAPNGLAVAAAQGPLATVLQAQGNVTEALQCWRDALATRERVLSLAHPLTLQAQQGMHCCAFISAPEYCGANGLWHLC